MQFALPLEKMTIADKLRVLEEVWESLTQTPEKISSPSWHESVLDVRDQKVRGGSSAFQS